MMIYSFDYCQQEEIIELLLWLYENHMPVLNMYDDTDKNRLVILADD